MAEPKLQLQLDDQSELLGDVSSSSESDEDGAHRHITPSLSPTSKRRRVEQQQTNLELLSLRRHQRDTDVLLGYKSNSDARLDGVQIPSASRSCQHPSTPTPHPSCKQRPTILWHPIVKGLSITREFLSQEEQHQLLEVLDTRLATALLKLRVTTPHGTNAPLNQMMSFGVTNFPKGVEALSLRIKHHMLASSDTPHLYDRDPAFNQAIINEYKPGDGIRAHVDLVHRFDDGIAAVSLASPAVMTFCKVDVNVENSSNNSNNCNNTENNSTTKINTLINDDVDNDNSNNINNNADDNNNNNINNNDNTNTSNTNNNNISTNSISNNTNTITNNTNNNTTTTTTTNNTNTTTTTIATLMSCGNEADTDTDTNNNTNNNNTADNDTNTNSNNSANTSNNDNNNNDDNNNANNNNNNNNTELEQRVLLLPGDLLCMERDSRWKWTHEICAVTHDIFQGVTIQRTRRVSLTLRRLTETT